MNGYIVCDISILQYDWVGSLQSLFQTAGVTIDENELAIVVTLDYITRLGTTLDAFSAE